VARAAAVGAWSGRRCARRADRGDMISALGAVAAAATVWLLVRSGGHAVRRLRTASGAYQPSAPAANRLARRLRRPRRERQRDAEVVTLSTALAAELRAGLPPGAALASVAGELPIMGTRLGMAARAVGRGALLGDELAVAAADLCCARLTVIAVVCAAGQATGSGIADVLDRVGGGFATDDESRAELVALAAGPRATAAVLAGLPVVAVGLGSALGLAPLHILFHTIFGLGLCVAAALLEVAGISWVRRITDRAQRG